MSRVVAAAVLVLAAAGTQGAVELRCTYSHREFCSEDGCDPQGIGGAYLLVPPLSEMAFAQTFVDRGRPLTIRRCDAAGCTPVQVNAATSGGFLNVWKLDGGYILKFFNGPEVLGEPGEFVEVATLWTAAYVSHGKCPVED